MSERGRKLALIFTRRGERLRPVSCRPMRRNERKVYEEAIREEYRFYSYGDAMVIV